MESDQDKHCLLAESHMVEAAEWAHEISETLGYQARSPSGLCNLSSRLTPRLLQHHGQSGVCHLPALHSLLDGRNAPRRMSAKSDLARLP